MEANGDEWVHPHPHGDRLTITIRNRSSAHNKSGEWISRCQNTHKKAEMLKFERDRALNIVFFRDWNRDNYCFALSTSQMADPTWSRLKMTSDAFPWMNSFIVWICCSRHSRRITSLVSSWGREPHTWTSSQWRPRNAWTHLLVKVSPKFSLTRTMSSFRSKLEVVRFVRPQEPHVGLAEQGFMRRSLGSRGL
jgi:hypothetical protein